MQSVINRGLANRRPCVRVDIRRTGADVENVVLTQKLKELLGIGTAAPASAAAPVKTAEQLTAELKALLGISTVPPAPPPSPVSAPAPHATRCDGCYHEYCTGECGILWCGCIDVCRGRCGLSDMRD